MATTLRALHPASARSGRIHEAVGARVTRPCGGAPLVYRGPVAPLDATGDAARGRPDRFGLPHQAEADRRTPTRWGMGGAGAGPPLVTAARRACTERSASPRQPGHDPHESRKSLFF